MLKQLPNVINSFSNSSQTTVSSLIRQMKVDKSDVSSLVSKLSQIRVDTSYSPSIFSQFSSLNREFFVDIFRDADVRIRSYYTSANTVGLMLNSMIDIFFSEIEKVEKDLDTLQVFIDNYEFIAGKDDLYNSNYVEKFDNYLNDYRTDGYLFDLIDRDGSYFDENGNGFVDTRAGVFKIGTGVTAKNALNFIDDINIKTNYDNYKSSDSGFYTTLNDNRSDSWNVTIKSPVILTSKIDDIKKYISYDLSYINGAQNIVEMSFAFPQEIDTIYITPGHGNGLQLLQAVLFSDVTESYVYKDYETILQEATDINQEVESYIEAIAGDPISATTTVPILTEPKQLDSITEISFPRRNVSKVVLIFNQPVYSKNENTTSSSELNAKAVYDIGREIREIRRSRTDKLQDLIYNLFLRNNSIKDLFKNKYMNDSYYSYKYPVSNKTFGNKNGRDNFSEENIQSDLIDDKWNTILSNLFQNFFVHMIKDNGEIFDTSTFVDSGSMSSDRYDFRNPGMLPQKDSNNLFLGKTKELFAETVSRSNRSIFKDLFILEKIDQYEYSFSIKSIEFAAVEKIDSNKACFVSKKIPFNGYPLALKASIVKSKNLIDFNRFNFDLKEPVSYELSISNTEIPVSENDWLPILEYGKDTIDSEVLFFDSQSLSAYTRFYFKKETFVLYKDGYIVSPDTYSLKENSIILNSLDVNSIYACKYQTDLTLFNYDNVDFIKSKLFQESTKSYFNDQGQGEGFSTTDYTGRITLSNLPYVNTTYTESAGYNPAYGTTFSSDYQGYTPVKVLLSDGSYAINLTNYTNSKDLASFPDSSRVYFIQNGKEIVFNQIISDPFSVVYEYVSNSTRFRIILRKNVSNILYQASVDAVIVKAKTKNYDPYYDKLTKALIIG
jgi:hypothetical protein